MYHKLINIAGQLSFMRISQSITKTKSLKGSYSHLTSAVLNNKSNNTASSLTIIKH
jgi:hypothetical protein